MILALVASAFLVGFAGSGHCAAMCGPIVTLLETGIGTHRTPAWQRAAYQCGRLAWYLSTGVGVTLIASNAIDTGWGHNIATALRLISVVVVLAMAVNLLRSNSNNGVLERLGHSLWRRISPLARFVLPMTSPTKAFFAGMLWGAIPCGMLYGMIALAAASASPSTAAWMMIAFWLGTLPSLLALGLSLRLLKPLQYRPLAGCVLIIVAAISVYNMLPQAPAHDHSHHGQMSSAHILR